MRRKHQNQGVPLAAPPQPLPLFLSNFPDLFSVVPHSVSPSLSFPLAQAILRSLPCAPGTWCTSPFPSSHVGPTFLIVPSMTPLSLPALILVSGRLEPPLPCLLLSSVSVLVPSLWVFHFPPPSQRPPAAEGAVVRSSC